MIQSLIVAALVVAQAAPSPPSRPALERAFVFASALESDPKDRATAQAAVALEALALEDGEQAAAFADRVLGWQRGVVHAEIAAWHARRGRAEPARSSLRKAQAFAEAQEGWQGPRIRAHVGVALAALGEADAARAITTELAANDRQYNGMAVVASARALAARGQLDAALAEIRKTEAETDYEFALGRTSAYLELARLPAVPRERRLAALRAARAAAEQAPVWTRVDLLLAVARELHGSGESGEGRQTLESAESLGRALAPTSVVRAGALSGVAETWAELGERARAREVLDDADRGVAEMQAIDRPEMLARVAAATTRIPDADLARQRFDRSLTEAEGLVNARPRALAVVGICRAMARSGVVPDERTATRLDALRRGLGAPW